MGKKTELTRDEAWALLNEHNKEDFHIRHALIVEGTLRYFAKKLGYAEEEDFWGLVGLLHDLDFEEYPEEHCVKVREMLRDTKAGDDLIRAIVSHGYGASDADVEPTHEMEKVLYAADELTGLIGAVALMRPSKSVQDLELKSVKKKYKNANFAAGCSREIIENGAKLLGWELDDLISETILALRATDTQD
ncbi:MAG: hydrolase [Clostridiales Family XIII bacterium]|nr:hydrolase [Clostridiales Family XIII bacterium]